MNYLFYGAAIFVAMFIAAIIFRTGQKRLNEKSDQSVLGGYTGASIAGSVLTIGLQLVFSFPFWITSLAVDIGQIPYLNSLFLATVVFLLLNSVSYIIIYNRRVE